MTILPAIDLLDGKVVRLAQGKRDQVTVYSDDPVGMSRHWAEQGASWLHVVDLNGAFEGAYVNLPVAKKIIEACGIAVELSGGIRTQETLEQAIAIGAARVVLGTKACEDPAFVKRAVEKHGAKIAVAIDAKAGQVVSRGWVSSTPLTAAGLAREMVKLGVLTLICTDVARDGMMRGPNLTLMNEVLETGPRGLIVSGGVSTLEDLKQLKPLQARGVIGAIVGKALYEHSIDLAEALAVLR
jgi:phosphoribosylformimino-5-aminoimidazole carboxamide ribotide isomerase